MQSYYYYFNIIGRISSACISEEWLAQEQHTEWATLSFIRVIACSDLMCEALSTGTWINVLIKIISSSHQLSGEQLVIKVVIINFISIMFRNG